MKNVTISMDESAAEWARLEAARRNTSVSRLVGLLVAEKMASDRSYERAMKEAIKFAAVPFEGNFLSRDQIYGERLDRFR